MKHGVIIPVHLRDGMARQAAEIATQTERQDAIREVCRLFHVSRPTARNLISRGRYLALQPADEQDLS